MSIASEIHRIKNCIAEAYTACCDKRATMPQTQNIRNLADTVRSIPQSGAAMLEKKDVNFCDYEGTVLYSYTFSEAAQLSVLPVLPEHTGLTAQGWTHTLSQIHTSVTKGYAVDVGATYTTSDGSSRFYITIPTNRYLTVPLNFEFSASTGTVTVDWGDGTTTTETGSTSHTYSPASYPANYVIKVTLISGELTWQGNTTTNSSSVFGESKEYTTMLKKAEIGVGSIGTRAFNSCSALRSVVLSHTGTYIGAYAFYKCSALKSVVIPYTVTFIGTCAFYDCCALRSVVIPHTVTSIGTYAFYNCSALTSVVLPGSLGSIDQAVFNSCKSLASLVIPDSIFSIGLFAFSYCDSLTSITIPASVRSLATSWLSGPGFVMLDLTAFNGNIPYLEGSFSGYGVFAVKDQSMVDMFSSATNWSNYAEEYVIKDW